MPKLGDYFITTLKKAHLEWGSHRRTNSRDITYGEGYLQIPRSQAVKIEIFNSNKPEAINIFNCNSVDGFLKNVRVKASGSSTAGDIYAKQLQGNGNLQLIGGWYNHVNAQIGDKVKVTWTSKTDIEIEKL
ncbi:hypothetical protein [Priestia aryabhattai]|uniref:hypothetical protein n=1 Tax=Priestia aryabhattai TaxID=412384 RepID=UPI000C06DD8F|nr:hypothetical protein [Priestia aryabhattai]